MGVFYHLRYPLFALDKMMKKVRPEGKLVFQTMVRGSDEVKEWKENYHFWKRSMFADPAISRDAFRRATATRTIQTNWWVPNRAAAEACCAARGWKLWRIRRRKRGFVCRAR